MPRKTSYRHYNVSEPDKKTYTIDKFRGVNYTPNQLNVDDAHAVEISNIVYKDKINQKRNGWEQITKVTNVTYYTNDDVQHTNSTNINGLWIFEVDGIEYVIAHIGKLLFRIMGIGKDKTFLNAKVIPLVRMENDRNYVDLELNDSPSSAFYGSGNLYILDGNKYTVLKIKNNTATLSLVEDDEETYIPTTTIGITYKDSAVNMAAPLDDVNLLTQWRKNKLVSGTYVADGTTVRTTRFWDYELDTAVYCKNPNDINNIKIKVNVLKEVK